MARNLIVVDSAEDWALAVPGVEIVSARDYLTDPKYSQDRATKIFNCCKTYKYQSLGYYVSLLAEARGHRAQPSISTIQGMKSQVLTRIFSDDLEELIERNLSNVRSNEFVLSIYFGRTIAKRHKRLGRQLQTMFQAPLLRAHFSRTVNGSDAAGARQGTGSRKARENGTAGRPKHSGDWQLRHVGPIPASEIPESHHGFVIEAAARYFERPWCTRRTKLPRYDIAILWDESESESPSDERAIQRFIRAGSKLGLDCDVIDKEDYSRIGEFDGLFLRQTTAVTHHTYRFARRAQAEGLVVIDDPESIVRCTNKVYLAELLGTHKIRAPKTLIVRRENIAQVAAEIGFPCILKMPDSSFSQGVVKVETEILLLAEIERCIQKSELMIAQEFLPTDYDWRVGILNRKPLFACKYHMAKDHWQIIKRATGGRVRYGGVEAVAIGDVPPAVMKTALKAANLIGDGFYGVDLKVAKDKCFVIEVNDNPNVDAGYEDSILREQLYLEVMKVFLDRIEHLKQGAHTRKAERSGRPPTATSV
jgi:glutathione synthase/RimK-type ligase-like ATP-grasp enzyme